MLSIGSFEFVKRIKTHIISALLVAIVIMLAVFSSCMIEVSYSRLKVLAPYLEGDGIYRNTYDLWTTVKGMEDRLTNTEDKFAISRGSVIGRGNGATEPGELLIYDMNTIDRYKPLLAEGEWLDKYRGRYDGIPCVISENGLRLGVGDTYKIDGKSENFIVVGKLMDNISLLGYSFRYEVIDRDYETFYKVFSHEKTMDHVVIISDEYLGRLQDVELQDSNRALVTYSAEITEEEKAGNLSIAKSTGNAIGLAEFRENSYSKYYGEVMMYVPILLATALSCVVTIGVITVLHFHRSQPTICIYQLCGMNGRQCFGVNMIPALATSLMALIVSGVGYLLSLQLPYNMKPFIGANQVRIIVLFVIIYIVIYQGVFMYLYRKTTLKVKLSEREGML